MVLFMYGITHLRSQDQCISKGVLQRLYLRCQYLFQHTEISRVLQESLRGLNTRKKEKLEEIDKKKSTLKQLYNISSFHFLAAIKREKDSLPGNELLVFTSLLE